MKILIFSTAYLPWVGGAEIAVKEITDRLPGIQFDMITANLNGEEAPVEKIGNITVYRLGKGVRGKFFLPISGLLLARKLHRRNQYDIAWSIMASQASIAAALFKIFTKNIRLILTLQEGDEEGYLKRYVGGNDILFKIFIQPFHRLVFKKADLATAISTYLKSRAEEGGVRSSVIVVPNGVDLSLFLRNYSEEDLWTIKTALGKTADEKYIITTSRLVTKNAVEDIIMSLTQLPGYVKLLVLGVGEDYAHLQGVVEKKHLTDRVVFLGHINHAEIPKYLQVSDVFVRPSLSEGMGNSFIEAMAAGIPVVATPVGGIVDFLRDGETGLFAEVHNPHSIAVAVKKLLDQPALREHIVHTAREMVIARYDWKVIAEEMKVVFESQIPQSL